jgi:hypothetical protein
MDSCNISAQLEQQILTCLAGVGKAWTGLAEALAGTDCSSVARDLNCFGMSQACGGAYPLGVSPDPNTPWICQPVIIYVGVRFV